MSTIWPMRASTIAVAIRLPTNPMTLMTAWLQNTGQNRRRAIAIDARRGRGRPSARPPMTAVASTRDSIATTRYPMPAGSAAIVTHAAQAPVALRASNAVSPTRTYTTAISAATGPADTSSRNPA